ncbi:MAG: hypothetical protein WC789_01150 [Lentisphaeria bacterium]
MWLELPQLELPVLAAQDLRAAAAAALRLPPDRLCELRILRRSIDARQHRQVKFLYRLAVRLAADARPPATFAPWREEPPPALAPVRLPGATPVVVGAGPAGLFAALALCEAGLPPLILDRGQPVPERAATVERFWAAGELDPESNLYFGEGGAGTFSDGKLNTRSKDPLASKILATLAELGAPAEILYDAKPHIGTDRLLGLLPRFRARLEAMGARFRFGTRLDGLRRTATAGGGLEIALDGAWTAARPLILACGHSAFDTYRLLLAAGVPLEPKPLAIGCRLEHPAEFASRLFHGPDPRLRAALGHVQYNVTAALAGGGSVYSFCCCPGGEVVAGAAAAGLLNVNGMSSSRRDSPFTNAGIVTPVGAAELPGDAEGMLRWREALERRCFELGGGAYAVPAQTAADFLAGRPSRRLPATSCRRPTVPADLKALLPAPVAARLREGLGLLERKHPGWVRHGVLLGIETTTSAPVRVVRTPHGAALGWPALLPVGEGSGHAGGIVTSALDGWRSVAAWLQATAGGAGLPPRWEP